MRQSSAPERGSLRPRYLRLLAFSAWLGCLGAPRSAGAQLELGPVVEALKGPAAADAERLLAHLQRISGSDAVLVRKGGGSWPAGVVPLSSRLGLLRLSSEPGAMSAQWSPPRRLLLDRAAVAMELSPFRAAAAQTQSPGAGSGAGVLVGMVDSGLDLRHPDLLDAEGKSRVRWWLDFGRAPLGIYPELEASLGCASAELSCAVLGPPELLELSQSGVLSQGGENVVLAPDRLGHGTLTASLAAGSGVTYRGVAPEAELLVARVAGDDGAVGDAEVLVAARFLFERAAAEGRPVVVNLSLGGDFGPHDGSSALGQGLTELVQSRPGQAIVVAAGNSGALAPPSSAYPGLLGVHTQVYVPRGGDVRVPLVTPPGDTYGQAGFYVWAAAAAGERLEIGLETPSGEAIVAPVAAGKLRSVHTVLRSGGEADYSVLNQSTGGELDDIARGAAVIGTGSLFEDSSYLLHLRGGTLVDLWVQSGGVWGAGTSGALFPGAMREGTINVPADSAELISVGTTWNRPSWPSYLGGELPALYGGAALSAAALGQVADFSSAGPGQLGAFKPELVAPGAAIVGALSQQARPLSIGSENRASMFFASPLCWSPLQQPPARRDCAVVDSYHGVAAGTSMAAPLVSGVVALLFERDPTLTQAEVRGLLMAGAQGGAGAGHLAGIGQVSALGALLALEAKGAQGKGLATAAQAELAFSDTFAYPGGPLNLQLVAQVKDAAGRPAQVTVIEQLALTVTRGRILSRVSRAPGLLEAVLQADSDAGGRVLTVQLGEEPQVLARGTREIAADRGIASGEVLAEGGCTVGGGAVSGAAGAVRPRAAGALGWLLAAAALACARRGRRPSRPA